MKLTKEQYVTLVKSVYLANWMVEEDEDLDPNNEYSQLEQFVLDCAKEYEFEGNVECEAESNMKALKEEYEDESDMFDIIENYDDSVFYSRLAGHFASVEMDKYENLSEEEADKKEEELGDKYFKILLEKGLNALSINEK